MMVRNGWWTGFVLVAMGLVIGSAVSILMFSSTFTAQIATADSGLACMDANGNGVIDRAEVTEVINVYLFGPPSPPQDGTTRSKA